jgi:hypothetical protein
MGWVGVDLDGTLADDTKEEEFGIGPPVKEMVDRVKMWLSRGIEVRIFTARLSSKQWHTEQYNIRQWCTKHIGKELEVTSCKDYDMVELWDDRAVTVERNTGRRLTPPIKKE